MTDKPTQIFEPDFTLKRKLGGIDIRKIMNEGTLKKAQKVVDSSSDNFLDEVAFEVLNVRRGIYSLQDEHKKENGIFAADARTNMIKLAFAIKSRAGMCGYPLMTAIGKSLYLFCETRKDNQRLTNVELDIITWHGETLTALYSQEVKDDNSAFARDLFGELEKISKAFIKV